MLTYPENYVVYKPFAEQIEFDLAAGNEIRYLFIGKPGTGKTVLARLVMQYLIDEHRKEHGSIPKQCMKSVSELYREYLRLNDSQCSDKHEAIDNALKTLILPYVVLDDLGNEMNSVSSNAFIAELFSYQYERLAIKNRKPNNVIITTNFGSTEIGKLYGDRIVDRILEVYTIFQFDNVSFRRSMAKIISNKGENQ